MTNKRDGTEGRAGESLNGDTRTDSGVLEREAPSELARSVNGRTAVGDRLRIIIADPDPLARRVIRDSLRLDGGFIVSAEAKHGVEAVELAVHYRPELVLMEVGMPGLDGIGACREITTKAPEVRRRGRVPVEERQHRGRRTRAALSRGGRGGGYPLADQPPRAAAARHGRERHRHASGQEPADDARVGGARSDLRRRLHA
jgi:CheY-like chemotaxis protein